MSDDAPDPLDPPMLELTYGANGTTAEWRGGGGAAVGSASTMRLSARGAVSVEAAEEAAFRSARQISLTTVDSGLTMVNDRLHLETESVLAVADASTLAAQQAELETTVASATGTLVEIEAGTLERTAKVAVQKLGDLYRWVTGDDHRKSGRTLISAETRADIGGRRQRLDADSRARMIGDRIDLG